MKIGKRVYRLVPCPWYDVEGIESWLESMAQEGLFLRKEAHFGDFTSFEQGEPKTVRYRLEAAQRSTSFLSESGGEPDAEAVEMSGELGWEYLTKCGQFYIYACDDPDAPELNTDPSVQAMALSYVRKDGRAGVIVNLVWLLLLLGLTWYGRCWLLLAMQYGSWLVLLTAALMIGELVFGFKRVFMIRRLRKKLLEGSQPDRKKDWKKHAFGFRVWNLLSVLVAVVWVFSAGGYWLNSVDNPNEIPITEYQGELPFLRLSEIGVEGSFKRDEWMDHTNKIKVSSDWLAETVIESNECGEFMMEDGRRIDCAMYVTYTDMRTSWLARELAAEYPVSGRREVKKDRFQFFDIPSAEELGVDSAVAYSAYPMGCAVVLVKGSEVWKAELMQFREDSISIDEWVRMFAGELNR